MRWTVTIKDQTYGSGVEIPKYACRVTRTGGTVRVSVENMGSGTVREGRFLMPRSVARLLGDALRLAAGDTESADIVIPLDEAKTKKPSVPSPIVERRALRRAAPRMLFVQNLTKSRIVRWGAVAVRWGREHDA